MQKNIKYSLYTECISMILKEYTECISMILGGLTQGKVLINCTYNSAGGVAFCRVPTDTGKPGKMRQLFPVREKSGNFEKILKSQGKVREF